MFYLFGCASETKPQVQSELHWYLGLSCFCKAEPNVPVTKAYIEGHKFLFFLLKPEISCLGKNSFPAVQF